MATQRMMGVVERRSEASVVTSVPRLAADSPRMTATHGTQLLCAWMKEALGLARPLCQLLLAVLVAE